MNSLSILIFMSCLLVSASFAPKAALTYKTAKSLLAVPKSDISRSQEALHKQVQAASSLFGIAALSVMTPAVVEAYGVVEEPKKKKDGKVKVQESSLGIKYIDLKVGEGSYPSAGDIIAINYIGFLKDGKEFDAQYTKKNLSFKYGSNQIIPGIEDVLATMRPGGQRSCTIPAKYAYGSKGICVKGECLVQPGEDLKYVITLKRVAAAYN